MYFTQCVPINEISLNSTSVKTASMCISFNVLYHVEVSHRLLPYSPPLQLLRHSSRRWTTTCLLSRRHPKCDDFMYERTVQESAVLLNEKQGECFCSTTLSQMTGLKWNANVIWDVSVDLVSVRPLLI